MGRSFLDSLISIKQQGKKTGTDVAAEPAFTIKKAVEDKMQVFGWASISQMPDGIEISDWEGDMIAPEELEKAAYSYVLNFRDTGERHDPGKRKKGKLIESVVLTSEKQRAIGIPSGSVPIGWWVGFQITDPETWAKIKSGEFRMFSIEGTGKRQDIKDDDPAYPSSGAKE